MSEQRRSRDWWAIDSDGLKVKRVIGYECPGYNPPVWWVPSLGYSLTEGYHVFETQEEAMARARDAWGREQRRYADAIRALKEAGGAD